MGEGEDVSAKLVKANKTEDANEPGDTNQGDAIEPSSKIAAAEVPKEMADDANDDGNVEPLDDLGREANQEDHQAADEKALGDGNGNEKAKASSSTVGVAVDQEPKPTTLKKSTDTKRSHEKKSPPDGGIGGLWKDRVVLVCPECLAEGKVCPWSREAKKGNIAKCCFIKKSTAGELKLPLLLESSTVGDDADDNGVARLDLSTNCENPTRFKNQRQAMQDHYRLQHADFAGELPLFVRRVRSQNHFAPGTSAKEKQRVYQMNAFERKKRKIGQDGTSLVGTDDITDGEESKANAKQQRRRRRLQPFSFLQELDLSKSGITDFVDVLSGAKEQDGETDVWSHPDTTIKACENAIDVLIRIIEKVRSTFNIEGVTKAYKFRGLAVRKEVSLNQDMEPEEVSKVGFGAETFYKLLHMALESLTEFHSQAEAIAVQNKGADRKRKRHMWPEVNERPARFYMNEDIFERMIHEADANFMNRFHQELPKSVQILIQDAILIRDDRLDDFPRSVSPWGIVMFVDEADDAASAEADELIKRE